MQVGRECNEVKRIGKKVAYFGEVEGLLAQHRVLRRIRRFCDELPAVSKRYVQVAQM